VKAIILLEDGTIIEGNSIGAEKTAYGEIVFNTGMTGYQEVLTDPSYGGQVVVMTYPLIGNYGTNPEDTESDNIHLSGFIIKEYCEDCSNWKSTQNLKTYLKENNIFAIANVDTRMLTKKIRSHGAMNCLMTTEEITEDLKNSLKNFKFPSDIVSQVSRKSQLNIENNGTKKIGIIDLGLKQGIIKHFVKQECNVTVFPWDVSEKEILNANLDAVLFSNGPGDPKDVKQTIKTAENLIGKLPIFGICLGHQILCLALGGDTYKMKFGHRGSNHPVINLQTNKVLITSQNHGYAVLEDSMDKNTQITYKNINDGTVEGFSHPNLNIHTVQFHPEAGPGPADANFIFKDWLNLLGEEYAKK
jgi:carbamoyl-phosphate synthase small subunit